MFKLTFVVVSSKDYEKLIDGFIHFATKFEANQYFNFLFALESSKRSDFANFRFLTTGKYIWSERLRFALDFITDEIIYLVPEDFYFHHDINLKHIDFLISIFDEFNMDYLAPTTNTYNLQMVDKFPDIEFYKFRDKARFKRLHWMNSYGIYRTKFLKNILFDNENIWEYEFNVGYRISKEANNFRYFISVKDPFALYAPGIIFRGELTKSAKEFLRDNNYSLDWTIQTRIPIIKNDGLIKRMNAIPRRYFKILFNTIRFYSNKKFQILLKKILRSNS